MLDHAGIRVAVDRQYSEDVLGVDEPGRRIVGSPAELPAIEEDEQFLREWTPSFGPRNIIDAVFLPSGP